MSVGIFILSLVIAVISGAVTCCIVKNYIHRKHVCSLTTAERHREEGIRFINKAIRTKDLVYRQHLRNEAFHQFVKADQIENGPYWS